MAIDPFLRKNTPSEVVSNKSSVPSQNSGVPVSGTPQKFTPKGSTLSFKTVLWGCVGFVVLLVGLAALVFYFMIQNPDQYARVGLDRTTVQNLLTIFAFLFFGFLFFLGLGLLIVNGYKFITVKNKPRTGYLMVTIIGFVLGLFSIAVGAGVLTRINNLALSKGIDIGSLIVPSLVLADGPTNIHHTDLKLIAPASMVFALNSPVFTRQILPTLGTVVDIQSIVMSCGNDQTLSLVTDTALFDGSCQYFTKGSYPIVVTVTYTDRQTAETKTISYDVGALQFVSEILVTVQDGTVTHGIGELIAGKAPRKITFDAAGVFRDLSLPDYRSVWDVNGDGQTDGENVVDITWIYNEPKLYHVAVRFPGINTFAYSFPLRIEQPDVPICILSATQTKGTTYTIQAIMTGRTAKIDGYSFSLLDINDGRKLVGTQKSPTASTIYDFPGAGLYAIKLDFVTSDGRQGSCESQNIAVGQADFTINYDIFYKTSQEPKFIKVDSTTPVSLQGSTLTIQELPTIIQLHINDIQPISATARVAVFFNDTAILSSDDKTFEMRVNEKANNIITIVVDDPARDAKTEQQLFVAVEQAAIVGKLDIKPGTVGVDPFAVTFDASTTVLQDTTDEIVYFSWDFGDGITKPNVSQAVISHTYTYDYDHENGMYKPSVTITTKKGLSMTIKPSSDIIVKKAVKEAFITIDSHPAQIARIGDTVDFSLDISGLPSKITWNFSNGNTVECTGRQCISTSQVFTENKNYTIKVKVDYDSQPSIEGKIVLKVQ